MCLLAYLSKVNVRLLGNLKQVTFPPLRIKCVWALLIQQCSTVYAEVIEKNTAAMVTSVAHVNKLYCYYALQASLLEINTEDTHSFQDCTVGKIKDSKKVTFENKRCKANTGKSVYVVRKCSTIYQCHFSAFLNSNLIGKQFKKYSKI